jgi:hypothetical protein
MGSAQEPLPAVDGIAASARQGRATHRPRQGRQRRRYPRRAAGHRRRLLRRSDEDRGLCRLRLHGWPGPRAGLQSDRPLDREEPGRLGTVQGAAHREGRRVHGGPVRPRTLGARADQRSERHRRHAGRGLAGRDRRLHQGGGIQPRHPGDQETLRDPPAAGDEAPDGCRRGKKVIFDKGKKAFFDAEPAKPAESLLESVL